MKSFKTNLIKERLTNNGLVVDRGAPLLLPTTKSNPDVSLTGNTGEETIVTLSRDDEKILPRHNGPHIGRKYWCESGLEVNTKSC